jgi:hypothetical protein
LFGTLPSIFVPSLINRVPDFACRLNGIYSRCTWLAPSQWRFILDTLKNLLKSLGVCMVLCMQ